VPICSNGTILVDLQGGTDSAAFAIEEVLAVKGSGLPPPMEEEFNYQDHRSSSSSSSSESSKSRADTMLLFCAFLSAVAALLSFAFTAMGHVFSRSMAGLKQVWNTMTRHRGRGREDAYGAVSVNVTTPAAAVGASGAAGTPTLNATRTSPATFSPPNYFDGAEGAAASMPRFLSELNRSVNAYGGVNDDRNPSPGRTQSSPTSPSSSFKFEEASLGCPEAAVAESGMQSGDNSSSNGFPSQ